MGLLQLVVRDLVVQSSCRKVPQVTRDARVGVVLALPQVTGYARVGVVLELLHVVPAVSAAELVDALAQPLLGPEAEGMSPDRRRSGPRR